MTSGFSNLKNKKFESLEMRSISNSVLNVKCLIGNDLPLIIKEKFLKPFS